MPDEQASLLNLKNGGVGVLRAQQETLTASGTATISDGTLVLDGTGGLAVTLKAMNQGETLAIIHQGDSGQTHVVTTPSGVTFDGTNNTATFDAINEALVIRCISATQYSVVSNVGAVALSAV